jgi:UPF0271 protein
MHAAVTLAQRHGVAIGAHPGFADRMNFGRKEIGLSRSSLRRLVEDQVAALAKLAPVRHVKPHGALYNLAARDADTAEAIAQAVQGIDSSLILFALAGSCLVNAGRARGLNVAEEVFADRTYQPNGTLTPRSSSDALIVDENAAVAQVLTMIRTGVVRAVDGTDVKITADTVCLHGDGQNAVAFARRLSAELRRAGVQVTRFTDHSPRR